MFKTIRYFNGPPFILEYINNAPNYVIFLHYFQPTASKTQKTGVDDSCVFCSCSCPSGFTGPRCQKTSRTFSGAGWAWYPPLQTCESSHLSLEFLARKADGQLIYNGPVGPPKPGGIAYSGSLIKNFTFSVWYRKR